MVEALVGKSGQAGDIFLSLCFRVGRAGSVCLDIAVVYIEQNHKRRRVITHKIAKYYLEIMYPCRQLAFTLSLVKTTQLDKSANPAPGSGSVQLL